jgi:transposase
MGVLSKHTIETYIIPYLPVNKRGPKPSVPRYQLVNSMLYRLKTGCQWRELPITEHFGRQDAISWNTVFYHFNQWSLAGCWQAVWLNLLKTFRHCLDLSSAQVDGSHTPAKNGGDAIGYQGRKAAKTTNALFLTDKQGVVLAMSTPQAGEHHDLFEIQTLFEEICTLLKQAGISLQGLFLNADAGFDAESFRLVCEAQEIHLNVRPNPRNSSSVAYEPGQHVFDEVLYADRGAVERSNAWLDGFKALLVRFEFSVRNWKAFHFIAFFVIFFRKIPKKQKP